MLGAIVGLGEKEKKEKKKRQGGGPSGKERVKK